MRKNKIFVHNTYPIAKFVHYPVPILSMIKKDLKEILILYGVLVAMFFNFLIFIRQPILCNTINVLLLCIYFYLSQESRKQKTILLITWIVFSVVTICGESFIISFTGELEYKNKDFMNAASSWLFVVYLMMVMFINLMYKILDRFL